MNDCLEQLRTLDPRMAEAVVVDGATGCWVWQLSCTRDGYPLTYPNKRTTRAHRRSYQLLVGEIPADRPCLDHLCRVRRCINPAHLEPVTNAENIRRGRTGEVARERHRAKTHCKWGHEFTPENTRLRLDRGCPERVCRACQRRNRQRRAA